MKIRISLSIMKDEWSSLHTEKLDIELPGKLEELQEAGDLPMHLDQLVGALKGSLGQTLGRLMGSTLEAMDKEVRDAEIMKIVGEKLDEDGKRNYQIRAERDKAREERDHFKCELGATIKLANVLAGETTPEIDDMVAIANAEAAAALAEPAAPDTIELLEEVPDPDPVGFPDMPMPEDSPETPDYEIVDEENEV